MNTITCQVESLTSLTPFIYKVLLKPEKKVEFIAGQYLNFVMSDEDKRPFSIASSPTSELIELQIGAFEENSYAMQVIERIKSNSQVTIEMPLGNSGLVASSQRPLLLLAGGTGFSYIKSMFELLAEQQTDRAVIVYWGVREPSALYELEQTASCINSIANGSFIPVVQTPDDNWQGRTGLLHQAAMADINDLAAYDIYLAGRFDMVGIIREDFVKKGALVKHMYADAFAFI
ncbi:MAG: NAD(P)H-flavin reductase [Thalassotalea sp.]